MRISAIPSSYCTVNRQNLDFILRLTRVCICTAVRMTRAMENAAKKVVDLFSRRLNREYATPIFLDSMEFC